MLQTFIVYVENKPGVLNRVASLFRRRSFNIDSLTVGHSDMPEVSRMTIVTEADDSRALQVEANLYKLVNVLRVENVTKHDAVRRELALIKVSADHDSRHKVLDVANVFRSNVVDITASSVTIEVTGPTNKIDTLVEVLRPSGIIEVARTGVVAMSRGAEAPATSPEFVSARVPEESPTAIYAAPG